MEDMLFPLVATTTHALDMALTGRMVALVSQDEDTILAVFGSDTDPVTLYLARACAEHGVLPGAKLGVVQGKDIEAEWHTVVTDRNGRIWAATGPGGDPTAVADALKIAQHPAFSAAVIAVHEKNMVLAPAGRAG